MSEEIKIGDWMVSHSGQVFKVNGFSDESQTRVSGWPMDKHGAAHNPRFIRKYSGALSVLEGLE